MAQERMFPSRCPNCHRFLAEHAKPHCDWKTHPRCSWMRCECGTNIAPNQRLILPDQSSEVT